MKEYEFDPEEVERVLREVWSDPEGPGGWRRLVPRQGNVYGAGGVERVTVVFVAGGPEELGEEGVVVEWGVIGFRGT